MFQGIATLVSLALVLWAVGTHMFTLRAEAAAQNLTSLNDLLTDSAPGESSVHTISFGMPSGMATGEVFAITFPDLFDLSGLNITDITLTVNGDATTTAAAAGVDTWGVATGTHFVSFETPTDEGVASSSTFVIQIGSELGTMIVNPSATTSYEISIGGDATSTMQDVGQTRVAIIDSVYVSANVNTILTFNVYGTTTGAVCNGAPGTYAASTGDTLAFGTLSAGPGGRKTLCQDLTVATNALNGYVVTVEQDDVFRSTTGGIIDDFVDGSATNTPITWASPSNDVLDPTTWGHWGLSSTDGTTTRVASEEFDSAEWISPSTTPRVIMGHTQPSDGVTEGIGRASIAYTVEITALQEAGDDYNTTLTYIATPTF